MRDPRLGLRRQGLILSVVIPGCVTRGPMTGSDESQTGT